MWKEAQALQRLDTAGERRRTHRWGDRAQTFTWVNHIAYTWTPATGGRPRTTTAHVAFCHETWTDAQGEAHQTQWAWISRQPLTASAWLPDRPACDGSRRPTSLRQPAFSGHLLSGGRVAILGGGTRKGLGGGIGDVAQALYYVATIDETWVALLGWAATAWMDVPPPGSGDRLDPRGTSCDHACRKYPGNGIRLPAGLVRSHPRPCGGVCGGRPPRTIRTTTVICPGWEVPA